MADIELVIKIDEEDYLRIKDPNRLTTYWANVRVKEAIINGTPLPKGHGRLIDADALPLDAIDDANYGSNYIRIAPTVIEADKESEV